MKRSKVARRDREPAAESGEGTLFADLRPFERTIVTRDAAGACEFATLSCGHSVAIAEAVGATTVDCAVCLREALRSLRQGRS